MRSENAAIAEKRVRKMGYGEGRGKLFRVKKPETVQRNLEFNIPVSGSFSFRSI